MDRAFAEICDGPVQVLFDNRICEDCGLVGDERILSPFCHDTVVELPGSSCLGITRPARRECANCGQKWSNRWLGNFKKFSKK